jgi:alpha-L-arabinofuranosidase
MKNSKMVLVVLTCVTSICANLSANISVKIDTQKTREPISEFIYGQFIEHLGRCFYGGLWAEMLQDRKFYYPITYDYHPWATGTDPTWGAGPYKYLNASPWKVIGPRGTVSMDTTDPFVGIHTPVIHLPGGGTLAGISQDGLAVLKDKKYVGHIILAGDETAAPVEIRLVLDNGATLTKTIKKITADYQSYPFKFTVPAASDNARIEIVSQGKGSFKIGTLSLMPADNIDGWRRDVVDLLKQLDAPIYRWPGGNFVSGYNWRDGIGPRDKRPPRKNPAWKGVESNDVGSDETMQLMRLIHAQAYVAVNTGLGGVKEAANEVQYFNGSANTPMGKLRAENGHPKPYDVKYWAVGNEMFGNWQLGHMPLAEYVQKHNRVADAIWKVDPSAKLVAVGNVGEWDKTMLTVCMDHMNYLSEHIYCREMTNVVAHVQQLADQIRGVAGAFREDENDIPGLKARHIRIAMDEWNYWYGDYIYGELGVRYHLKDALGVAEGLDEYFRNSDIFFMANYAQTVNVIGCIKVTPTAADFATTGLVLKMYRHHYGSIPIKVAGETEDLDVAAAWTKDKKAITVAIVNPDPNPQEVKADFEGASFEPDATRWVISNPDPDSYNVPGETPNVVIKREAVNFDGTGFDVPGYSVSLYRLEVH